MFTIWENGGIKAPYTPGGIRSKRVEKIQRTLQVQKNEHDSQESTFQSSGTVFSHVSDTYQQYESRPHTRKPAILAKQIMSSPVMTLSPTSELSDAWEIIQGKRFRHVPVLSSQGHLVGILSDRDLFRLAIEMVTSPEEAEVNAPRRPIEEIMVRHVLSAAPETEIRAIARTLFEERIGAMPIVTEQGDLVGILTRSDILRTVVNEAPFELWV